MPPRRLSRVLSAAAALSLIAVAAGCSSTNSTGTMSSTTSGHGSKPPAGLPAFYAVPNPLPHGRPGEIIKTQQVSAPGMHGSLWRVMYHSRSVRGADIAVTGLIAIPEAKPPKRGFPVISWAHGTTGIADKCAPSLAPSQDIPEANQLLDAGYLVTATDYEGLGTPGRHPYIVGESEARGVIDIVKAARAFDRAHASDHYLVWGHSQGGHAAMSSLHLAASLAPRLHLVGVVAGAPPSQLELVYQFLKTSPFKNYLAMAAAGFNAAYGDKAAPLNAVIKPAGMRYVNDVDKECAGDLGKEMVTLDVSKLVKADPATVPKWKKLLDENDPGKFAKPAKAPLLIIQGGADEQIPVASTQLLFGHLCKIHQDEERWIYPGQSHAGVIPVSMHDMLTWIAHRFAGAPNPDPMRPTGQPDVAVQRCPS